MPDAPKAKLPVPLADRIPSGRMPLLALLLAAACLTSLTGSAFAPIFPDAVAGLELDPRWAGMLVSMPKLTLALAAPLLGALAARIGQFRVLVASLVSFAVFGMAGALAQTFGTLAMARGLVGAASGGISAAGLGVVGRWFSGTTRSRLIGYTASAIAATSILFPLLAGWLGSFHWRYAFGLYGLALPVAFALAIAARSPANASAARGEAIQIRHLLGALRAPGVLSVLVALFGASAVFYTAIVYAPLYFQAAIGADAMLNGTILAARAVGAALISAVGAARMVRQFGTSATLSTGWGLMALTLAIIPLLATPQVALLAAFGFGIGFGLIVPNLYDMLAERIAWEQRATLLSLAPGLAALGQFGSPLIFGPVWQSGGERVFFSLPPWRSPWAYCNWWGIKPRCSASKGANLMEAPAP